MLRLLWNVLGSTSLLSSIFNRDDICAVIAIQDCRIKQQIISDSLGFNHWETIIHPSAVIAPDVYLGVGTIVFPNVTISVGCVVGKFNLIYTSAMLSNDVKSGDYSSIMSNVQLSDRVVIGDSVYISSGCCVYPGISIGSNAEIAVGIVVSDGCKDNERVGERSGIFKRFK